MSIKNRLRTAFLSPKFNIRINKSYFFIFHKLFLHIIIPMGGYKHKLYYFFYTKGTILI